MIDKYKYRYDDKYKYRYDMMADTSIDVDKIRCIVFNLLESSSYNLTFPEYPVDLLLILPFHLKVDPDPIPFKSDISGCNLAL
jgi:hypothetical protein